MNSLSTVIDGELGEVHTSAYFVVEAPGKGPEIVEAYSAFWARYKYFKAHPEAQGKAIHQIHFRKATQEDLAQDIPLTAAKTFLVQIASRYNVVIQGTMGENQAREMLADHFGKILNVSKLRFKSVRPDAELLARSAERIVKGPRETPFVARLPGGGVFKIQQAQDAKEAQKIVLGRLSALGKPPNYELYQLVHGDRYVPVSLGKDYYHAGPRTFTTTLPEEETERQKITQQLQQLAGVIFREGPPATIEASMGEDQLIELLQEKDIDVRDVSPVERQRAPFELKAIPPTQDIVYKGTGPLVQGTGFSLHITPGTVLRTSEIPVEGLPPGHIMVRAGSAVFSVSYQELPQAFGWTPEKEAALAFWREMAKVALGARAGPEFVDAPIPGSVPPSRLEGAMDEEAKQKAETAQGTDEPRTPVPRVELEPWMQELVSSGAATEGVMRLAVFGAKQGKGTVEEILIGMGITQKEIEAAKAKVIPVVPVSKFYVGRPINVTGPGQIANGPVQFQLGRGLRMRIVKPLAGGQILMKTEESIPRFFSLPSTFPGFTEAEKKASSEKISVELKELKVGDWIVPWASPIRAEIRVDRAEGSDWYCSAEEFTSAVPMMVKGVELALTGGVLVKDRLGRLHKLVSVYAVETPSTQIPRLDSLEEIAELMEEPVGWPGWKAKLRAIKELKQAFSMPWGAAKVVIEAMGAQFPTWPRRFELSEESLKLSAFDPIVQELQDKVKYLQDSTAEELTELPKNAPAARKYLNFFQEIGVTGLRFYRFRANYPADSGGIRSTPVVAGYYLRELVAAGGKIGKGYTVGAAWGFCKGESATTTSADRVIASLRKKLGIGPFEVTDEALKLSGLIELEVQHA